MKFTEEIGHRIIAALRERLPGQKLSPCAICGTNKWSLQSAYVRLTIQQDLVGSVLGGPAFPMVALICTNCGNTHLLNLKVLGLGDLVQPDPTPDVAQPE